MRDRYFISACLLIITLGMFTVAFPEGAAALLVVLSLTAVGLLLFRRYTDDEYLTTVFLTALVVRLAVGIFIHIYELREFFGGDAITYDFNGWQLSEYWSGRVVEDEITLERNMLEPGWGMSYLVGIIYYLIGRNIFAA